MRAREPPPLFVPPRSSASFPMDRATREGRTGGPVLRMEIGAASFHPGWHDRRLDAFGRERRLGSRAAWKPHRPRGIAAGGRIRCARRGAAACRPYLVLSISEERGNLDRASHRTRRRVPLDEESLRADCPCFRRPSASRRDPKATDDPSRGARRTHGASARSLAALPPWRIPRGHPRRSAAALVQFPSSGGR